MSRMVIAPFGMLAGLILLGLLVAGVVLLVVFLRNRKLLWVLGIAGAIAAVLVALAATFLVGMPAASHRKMRRDETVTATVADRRAVDRLHVERLAAGPADTSAFLADVYPSAAQAARALARQSAKSAESVSEGGLPMLRVTGRAPREMLEQVAEVFRGEALARKVEVSEASALAATQPRSGSEVLCALRVDAGEQGGVQLVLSGPTGQVTRTARFVTKPWAANFARYVSESAGSHVLAQSRWLCSSFTEADQAARDDAAGQLMVHFRQSIERAIAGGRLGPGDRPSDNELRRLIGVELRRGGLVTDRFTQRFRRPYGDVWRQSLLVDSSPKTVDPLAAAVVSQTAGHRSAVVSSWARIATSIGGLALLIFVLYLVLNAATKGYYVWVLRVAAAALVVAGIAAVLLLV